MQKFLAATVLTVCALFTSTSKAVTVSLVPTSGTFSATGTVLFYFPQPADGTYFLNYQQSRQSPSLGFGHFDLNAFPFTVDTTYAPSFVFPQTLSLQVNLSGGVITALFANETWLWDLPAQPTRQGQLFLRGTTWDYVYQENPSIGFVRASGNIIFGPQVSPVPEPSTYAALALGLLAIVARRVERNGNAGRGPARPDPCCIEAWANDARWF